MFFKEIDATTLKEMIDKGENLRLYDIRTPQEFAQGIIKGGKLVPLNTVPAKMHEIPEDKTIIFYCRSGARSGQACAYVAEHAGIEAINLRGGIIAWHQSGYEVVKPDKV